MITKSVFVLMAVGWYIIRFPHALRSKRIPVEYTSRDWREIVLLSISLCGLGVIPFIYVFTNILKFANYDMVEFLGYIGSLIAIASLMLFYQTHTQLGRNWSVSLDLRKNHNLITHGIYKRIRHPMYSAFWLWAIAQFLLLPNFIAGLSGLVGFGILYTLRVGREEKMMIASFGKEYEAYMARTGRILPK